MDLSSARALSAPPHTHLKYRRDIDGLRGVAILLVVVFHAFPSFLRGGFVGVDLFFVISGYLITGIILTDINQGGFSFATFYARRVRRIFPAALAVFVFCYVFGWFVLFPDEYKQLGKHLLGGVLFVSNLILWGEAGYFDNAADSKPLLHLWSLGVEEQFYLIWPIVVVWLYHRKHRLLLAMVAIWGGAFLANHLYLRADPVGAFYSPFSRFWELLSGGFLAYVQMARGTPRGVLHWGVGKGGWLYRRLPAGSSSSLSVIGVLLAVLAGVVIRSTDPFPGNWALLPVAAGVLMIQAGPDAWANRRILASRPLVWLGLISFPLYLWHWPLLSLAGILLAGEVAPLVRAGLVLLAVLLSWGTYRWIESPIRWGRKRRWTVPALCLGMVLVGLVGFNAYKRDGMDFRLKSMSKDTAAMSANKLLEERAYCKQLFPSSWGHCIATTGLSDLGSAWLIIGDSHGEALTQGFFESGHRAAQIPIVSRGKKGCPPLKGVERFNENGAQDCAAIYDPVFALGAQGNGPKVNVVVGRYAAYLQEPGEKGLGGQGDMHIQPVGPRLPRESVAYDQVLEQGLRATLAALARSGRTTLFVHQVPELGFDVRTCIDRPISGSQRECRAKRQEVEARQAAYRKIAGRVLAEFPKVRVFDPLDLFCDRDYCYGRIGDHILYRDDNHLGRYGSALLADALVAEVNGPAR